MSPGSPRCHPGLGMHWWLLALGTPEGEGTALLQQGGGDPPLLNVSLLVSTRTPRTRALLGAPGRLHCAFAPPAGPFTLQWLQHRHGATRRLLAFDSAAAHRTEAVPGVPGHGSPPSASQSSQPPRGTREVSLQLPPLSVSDDGAFVCSVSALHGQVQQVLQLHVIAPPWVSLLPSRLSPGVLAELRCDAVGFFPLDVEIRWERRTHGHTWPYLGDTSGDTPGTTLGPSWSSGHRRAADGTFSRSAGLRVAAVAPGDSYSCLVTHVAWNVPHRVTVVVAGEGHLGTHLGTSGTRFGHSWGHWGHLGTSGTSGDIRDRVWAQLGILETSGDIGDRVWGHLRTSGMEFGTLENIRDGVGDTWGHQGWGVEGLGTPGLELGTPGMELGISGMGLGTLGTWRMGLGTSGMSLGTPRIGLGTLLPL
ncbi:LOW QUALITY PROTEIN: tapasin-like [Taeniopygia guttata]|uniref:LOW QUALITY PROTEIN: tapasin-like n=1 Tax=Taeniopygia guttata TaxID=59729 RepID=UPI003BB94FA1